MKLITIIGARPQFIKSAPVSRTLKSEGFTEKIIHTGQHFDRNMSRIFFEEMGLQKPEWNLGVHSMSHSKMTGRMLEKIEGILMEETPEAVLVYGDTNSTLAGSLAASKLLIPVAHVEAGLRSFNRKMPEELNRIITDRLSSFLFCPTETAAENLGREGFDPENIHIENTGDVMFDALKQFTPESKERSKILKEIGLSEGEFILCTLHRQENTDDEERLESIIHALQQISKDFPVVFPVHPRTRDKISILHGSDSIYLIEPVGYLDMLALLSNCRLVMTDSGGLQKEAFFSGKFCITCRDETEWTELVENGYNMLCGADTYKIYNALEVFVQQEFERRHHFYGKGRASEKIAISLKKHLSQ